MNNISFRPKNQGAFTLLEVIIVVIVVGILAGLAVPRLFSNIKRAELSEALNTLGVIRRAMNQCALLTSGETGVPIFSRCDTLKELFLEDPSDAPGAVFDYTIIQSGGSQKRVIVRRKDNFADALQMVYELTGDTFRITGFGAYRDISITNF